MKTKNYHDDKITFQVYNEWEDIVNALDNNEQVGELFKALFAFAKRGEVKEFTGALKMALIIMTQQIQRDGEKWEKTCEKNAANIKKRWKKNTTDTSVYERNRANTNYTEKEKEEEEEEEKEKDINISPCGENARALKPTKHKHGEYNNVLLTDDEFAKLKAEIPNAEEYIERLSGYIASKGAKYKSHYATVRAWYRKDKDEGRQPVKSEGEYLPPESIWG